MNRGMIALLLGSQPFEEEDSEMFSSSMCVFFSFIFDSALSVLIIRYLKCALFPGQSLYKSMLSSYSWSILLRTCAMMFSGMLQQLFILQLLRTRK